ncbi:MAG: S41 family peptidase [Candidatus Krumholzibacteriota bacterium]|nr:S41 family peptidase [Candidatus Krumholzibacteriota bacterium]
MSTRTTFLGLLVVCLMVFCSSNATAQAARPGELAPIDAAARAAIVDSVTAIIDSVYVLGEPAARIVAEVRRALAAGEYDGIDDPAEFAERLHHDCQRVNHDGHFRVFALQPLDPSTTAAGQDENPLDVERRNRYLKAINYGFKKAEILEGGVGYLRFDSFSRGEEAYMAAVSAMNFISNSSAVILDLRNNGGGAASMIRFICGYLFEENTHLINWDNRAENSTVQSYSTDFVPGKRITEQPVYILTSSGTFSAAEEFTFDLKNLERATVVGATTGGGGHTVASYYFDFEGFRIGLRVPNSRAYNPKNNEGWEGVGVIPDIVVKSEQALDVAHADALRKLIEAEEDERVKFVYEWALKDIDSRLDPVKLTKKQMKKYEGTFGPRRVFLKDGELWYQRESGSPYLLEPMDKDLFRVGDIGYFRLSFGRDSSGGIVKVIGLYNNGRVDENEKESD